MGASAAWHRVCLGDLVSVKHGFAFSGRHFVDERTPDVLVTPGNFGIGGGFKLEKPKFYRGPVPPEFILSPGDLIVTMTDLSKTSDTLGYGAVVPALAGIRLLHNQRIGKVLLKRPDLTRYDFLQWVLRSDCYRREVVASASGSTVKHTAPSRIEAYRFLLPPLDEQRAIAHILGTLDDKIELNRKTNETLEAMARVLFKSWFVDFDPVRAKAEGRKPAGMDAETARLFPSELVDSELGEVPKGWTIAPLEHWASALSGGTPAKGDAALWGGDLPWISPKVMTSIHADEPDAFVTRDAVGNGTRLAPSGSTLIMVRGMALHQEVRVSQARQDVTFNQDVKAMVPRHIESELLLFALLDAQASLLGRVESSGHGTGKLPSEVLLRQPIVMPPREAQHRLAAAFRYANDRIGCARTESRILGGLRDELLPRLLSGELEPHGVVHQ